MRRKALILSIVLLVVAIVVVVLIQRLGKFDNPFNALGGSTTQLGSCGFLEEQHCNKGKIESIDINGEQFQVVGFNLPAGTVLKAPFDGEIVGGVFDTVDFPLKGNFAILNTKGNSSEKVMLIGDLDIPRITDSARTAGDDIGTIKGNNITNLNEYNLIILFYVDTGNNQKQNNEMFREYFNS